MRYQFRGKMHLPANDGWRTTARQKDLIILENAPDALFQAVVKHVIGTCFEEQTEGDRDGLTFGLLLNIMQQFPVDVRRAMVAAIASGQTMQLKNVGGEIVVDTEQSVEAFLIDMSEEADIRPSGIVVPSGADLVLP